MVNATFGSKFYQAELKLSERNQMGERELWRKEHSIDLDKEIWRRKIRSEL